MLFSLEWLRELCPLREPVSRLGSALTSRGLTVDGCEADGDDWVLDVDVPANRPDCLGHLGLARELSAAFRVPLAEPTYPSAWQTPHTGARLDVKVIEPDLCPRYTASIVRGLLVGPSPPAFVRRLERCGLRAINNVVDVSNLVLLELGQPIHCFDLPRLLRVGGSGPTRIVVRRARSGEILRTLDGVERRLDDAMLVIADAERAQAVAGVMGGAESEIHAGTTEIVIEAACFSAVSIRRTAQALGIQTDASYRFARGVDAALPARAQALAVELLARHAQGQYPDGISIDGPGVTPAAPLRLRSSSLRRTLGFSPDETQVETALRALQIGILRTGPEELHVTPPTWRIDLQREEDLVEEVARHLGYDAIPSAVPPGSTRAVSPPHPAEERVRDLLAQRGFHEAVGYAMIGTGEDDAFVPASSAPALALSNPIAETLAHLRRSVLPGLVRAVDTNRRRGTVDVRLFETGRVFLPAGPPGFAPRESQRLAVVWAGAAEPAHWSAPTRAADLQDLFGWVELLLASLTSGRTFQRHPCELAAFHPGQSATWGADSDGAVAWGGWSHPSLGERLGGAALMAEFDMDALTADAPPPPTYQPLPRVPAVFRDLSVVVPLSTGFARLLEVLARVAPPAPSRFELVDRYQGPPLAPGQVSLSVRALLTPSERTLTESEIETYRLALVEALRRDLGAELRG